MSTSVLKREKIKACTCAKCVRLCHRNPGWPTPKEAAAMVAAGHAKRLMLDWLDPSSTVGNDERIFVLCPASGDLGGESAPEIEGMYGYDESSIFASMFSSPYKGRCTFLTDEERCEVHGSGYKPVQCRAALGCEEKQMDNYTVARMWDSDAARVLVEQWKKAVNFGDGK